MDELKRELSFFRSLRDNKNLIESYDIDSQFELISNYINNVIVEAINDIIPDEFQGVIDNKNYLLANMSNGLIQWKQLSEIVKNYSIDFKKIIKPLDQGNVLYVNSNQTLTLSNSAIQDDMVLSIKNSIPIFKLIEEENFDNGAIISEDIKDKTIEKENLTQELINILNGDIVQEVVNSFLENDQLKTEITSEFIKENSFNINDITKFTSDIRLPFYSYDDSKMNLISDGAITNDLVRFNSIGGISNQYFNKIEKFIIKNKFSKNAICASNFEYFFRGFCKNGEMLNFSKLSPDFKIIRDHLMESYRYFHNNSWWEVNCVDKYSFDKEVQDAFTKKGC